MIRLRRSLLEALGEVFCFLNGRDKCYCRHPSTADLMLNEEKKTVKQGSGEFSVISIKNIITMEYLVVGFVGPPQDS